MPTQGSVEWPSMLEFSAAASVTTGAAQFIPPSGLATSTTLNPGKLMANAGFLTAMVVSFVGSASNVGGQTGTFQLLQSIGGAAAAPVAAAVSSAHATSSTTATTETIDFDPVPYAVGDVFTCTFTPSGGLTAVCTNVMVGCR